MEFRVGFLGHSSRTGRFGLARASSLRWACLSASEVRSRWLWRDPIAWQLALFIGRYPRELILSSVGCLLMTSPIVGILIQKPVAKAATPRWRGARQSDARRRESPRRACPRLRASPDPPARRRLPPHWRGVREPRFRSQACRRRGSDRSLSQRRIWRAQPMPDEAPVTTARCSIGLFLVFLAS